jgi:hypothetical protein
LADDESRGLVALACRARDRRDGPVGLGDDQHRSIRIIRPDSVCRVQHRDDGGLAALRLVQEVAVGNPSFGSAADAYVYAPSVCKMYAHAPHRSK